MPAVSVHLSLNEAEGLIENGLFVKPCFPRRSLGGVSMHLSHFWTPNCIGLTPCFSLKNIYLPYSVPEDKIGISIKVIKEVYGWDILHEKTRERATSIHIGSSNAHNSPQQCDSNSEASPTLRTGRWLAGDVSAIATNTLAVEEMGRA